MKTQLLFLALVAVAMAGCHGVMTSPSAVTVGPVVTQATPAVNTWAGTTTQGRGINFSIAGTAVTYVGFTVLFPSDACGGALTGGEGGSVGQVADGRLLASGSIGSNLQWSLDGNLTAQGAAAGTLTVNYTRAQTVPQVPPCSVSISATWTAERVL